jgi:hypothetical protein
MRTQLIEIEKNQYWQQVLLLNTIKPFEKTIQINKLTGTLIRSSVEVLGGHSQRRVTIALSEAAPTAIASRHQ